MSDNSWTAPGSDDGRGSTPYPQQPPVPPPVPSPGAQPHGAPPPGGPPPAAPPPPGQWGSVDLQPGIIPLRRLGLGDIYSGVMRLIRGNPGATLGMALVVTLAVTVPLTALAAGLTSAIAPEYEEGDFSTEASAAELLTSLPNLGQLVIGLLLPLFIAWATQQAVLGHKVGMGETWQATKGRVLPGLGALVLTGLLYLLPLILLGGGFVGIIFAATEIGGGGGVALGIVGGLVLGLAWLAAYLFLWTRFAFVFTALTLERLGPVAAISRSWALTRGRRFWPVLGIRVLTSFLIGLAALVLSCPLSLIGAGAQLAFTGDGNLGYVVLAVTNGLVLIITAVLTTPIAAGVDALLYIGQRIEQEGHDIELIRQAGGRPGGPTG